MKREFNSNIEVLWEAERILEYKKYFKKVPFLKFKEDWDVKIAPPIRQAMVRFIVRKENRVVSIYLDCHDNLGHYGKPYWELYPYVDHDTFRCDMEDTEKLLKAIEECLVRNYE